MIITAMSIISIHITNDNNGNDDVDSHLHRLINNRILKENRRKKCMKIRQYHSQTQIKVHISL